MARRKRTQARAEELKVQAPVQEFEGSKAEKIISDFFAMLRNNFKETVIVLSAAFVLLVGIAFFNYYQKSQDIKSLAAFEKLVKDPAMDPKAGAQTKALKLLENYNKTFSNNNALLRSGLKKIDLLSSKKKYKEAAKVAESLSTKPEFPEQRAFLLLKSAIFYENAKANVEALNAYEKTLTFIKEDGYVKAFTLFGQGRIMVKLGRVQEGRTAIKEMLKVKKDPQVERLHMSAAAFLLSLKNDPK